MWTLVRIGTLYAAPVAAVLVALVAFAVLLRRVRRGTVTRARAAALYTGTLLLPLAAVATVWGMAELSSYFAAPADYAWDGGAAVQVLLSLLPLGTYVGAPIVLLIVAFWTTLAVLQSPTRRGAIPSEHGAPPQSSSR
jgi:hypothetical protein